MKVETIYKLEAWCKEGSTTFSRLSFCVDGERILIHRYDGFGIPAIVQEFGCEGEVETFLAKSQWLKENQEQGSVGNE